MKRTPLTRKARLKAKTRLRPKHRKRDQDHAFALLIKDRDEWTCQWTGRKRSKTMEAAHIFAKQSHPATRYDPENVITLCSACHFRSHHGDFEEFRDFIIERMGGGAFFALKMRAQSTKNSRIPAQAVESTTEHPGAPRDDSGMDSGYDHGAGICTSGVEDGFPS